MQTPESPAARPTTSRRSTGAAMGIGNGRRSQGGVAGGTLLADNLLLLLTWSEKAGAQEGVALEAEQTAVPAPLTLVLARAAAAGPVQALSVVRLDRLAGVDLILPELRLSVGQKKIELENEAVMAGLSDLRTFLRQHLAGLDVESRTRIVEWLPSAVGGLLDGEGGQYSLSRTLQTVHESLREHPEPCVIAPEEPRGLQIDALLAIDPQTFWVRGWAMNADAAIEELTAVSPEGAGGGFLDRAMRFPRPDVEQFYGSTPGFDEQKSGFIGLVELGVPSLLGNGWTIEMKDSLGVAVGAETPQVLRDPLSVRSTILADFALTKRPDHPARADLFEPALTRLQARLAADVKIEDVRQHGQPPANPEVSVIVPLYRRIDFLEHQLTQFARDPEFAECDLIYILDSPEDAEALARLAPEMHALTGVPFRVVTLARNAGFSGANNAAAEVAKGRKLLLLNSDVLPDRPGWLGEMSAFFDATPRIGALSPKLLYEDDTLQHAGLYFLRAPGSPVWENLHYYKGLNRYTRAACVPRRVPAVTGACMLIDREQYESLGGLRGQFVQGDYEDSDLCLRLHELGLEGWYLPKAELYHLEAQSYPGELRQATTAYNTWLHSYIWDETITDVMDAQEGEPN
jgi:GT2 family glycosyltransferase